MRTTQAIVAIIQDGQGRFLVTFNAKWGGYAFPMIDVPEGGDILGSLAIQAAEHDLGLRLPNATAANAPRPTVNASSARSKQNSG